jgi:anhydro-N-acetylmuramic acid kinase|tara:strand:- start:108 stop:1184 length:1077 start_codon:yes stop_codon:yes gene_type:complete
MSGTSMDGVDASIIQSNGKSRYKVILDKYFEYPKSIYKNLTTLRDKIKGSKDLKKYQKQINSVEKEITIFHAKAVNEILKKTKANVDFLGFHGQTIFHNAEEKTTKQMGDGKLLSKLTKKTVVYDFRQNDLKNGGEGAPLTPIFHQMLEKKFNIKPVSFFNIGGILNRTTIWDSGALSAKDEGPGMCLIDKWIRTNSKKKYDVNGDIAKSGKVNEIVLDQYWDTFRASSPYKKSYDTSDFDISFAKGLSLEDGAATLTLCIANMFIVNFKTNEKFKDLSKEKTILCGGGRKNKFLVDVIKSYNKDVKLIDDYGIDGDFVESQAFAYLAIRSYLKLPISFPETTGVSEPCTGGTMVKNF